MELIHRPRRLRRTKSIRRMVRETKVTVDDLIYPLFIVPGNNIKKEIASLPGNYHLSLDRLEEEIEEIVSLKIPGVILFGIPSYKDEKGLEAYSDNGIIQKAVQKIKEIDPDISVITDVCLCEYTSHGHCGLIKDGKVDNDSTVDLIAKTALSHVIAGADMVAPSDMMDGRIGAIRKILDKNGYQNIPIMAYSVKYASAFYGPFREAAGSAPQFGDRKSYQMDPANKEEAVREMLLDYKEGADIIMIKPALAYLDVVSKAKELLAAPIAVYNVSGEYAMVKAASKAGWIDEKKIMIEMLTSMKRAGAQIIISYFAKEFAKLVMERNDT